MRKRRMEMEVGDGWWVWSESEESLDNESEINHHLNKYCSKNFPIHPYSTYMCTNTFSRTLKLKSSFFFAPTPPHSHCSLNDMKILFAS